MKYIFHKKITLGVVVILSLMASFGYVGVAQAANVGDIVNFNVDKSFDASGRTQVPATLVKISPKLYFYVEKQWWDSQTEAKQGVISTALNNLAGEFDNNIYPNLTSVFGSEWDPGADKDSKISILFESINSTEGGYFRETDEYEKIQLPNSNAREILYLSISNIEDPNVKIVLGHEFVHLITFNQKNKIFGVEEDTWLNEARADYSSTMLGYDNNYGGSNLQQRVRDFIENPSDSITDWSGTKYDYASVDLFTHYMVNHYGINILSDSLKSKSIGIDSINQALAKGGFKEDFASIFTDWAIALAINDCSQNVKYCYSDQNLNSLRVSPTLIFLPLSGDSSLSSSNVTKNWSGNWQKIIGGSGNLRLDFSSLAGLNFQVPYITYDKDNNYAVKNLDLDKNEKGLISIKDFGTNFKSLIIIPLLQTKTSGLDGFGIIYPYSFTVSIAGQDSGSDQILVQKLLDQIESLKKQIAEIIAQRQGLVSSTPVSDQAGICSQISNNLYVGSNGIAVSCLQQFLKNQGQDIYPEGFVTGNFGNLTKLAVIRFQEKYASEILTPAGLAKGSGNVGDLTRAKINQLINK